MKSTTDVAEEVRVDKVVGAEDTGPIVVATDDKWMVAVEEDVEVEVVVEPAADEAGTKVVGTADAVSEDTGINVVEIAVDPAMEPLPDWS